MIARDLPRACREARHRLDDRLAGRATDERALDHHLAACEACRRHARETSDIVDLLRGASAPVDEGAPHAPADLTHRLAAIAGDEAHQPLWFTCGSGELPSTRAQLLARMTAGSGALLVAVGLLFTLGLAMAPPVVDASDTPALASTEHQLLLGAGPGAQAVNAVLATAPSERLRPTTSIDRPQPIAFPDWRPLGRPAASALLQAGQRPVQAYAGLQRVTLVGDSDHLVADVRVWQRPGGAVGVSVLDDHGRAISSGVLPVRSSNRSLLPPQAVAFRSAIGGVVAGRPTTLLEAHRSDGTLAGRWWVDEGIGLVMWNETFDTDGHLVRSSGFVEFRVTSTAAPADQTLQLSRAPAPAERSGPSCSNGFACPEHLGGFTLVQVSADSPQQPSVVVAVYEKDGAVATVVQRRGHLSGPPATCYGVPRDQIAVVWQSGTVVYAVTSTAGAAVTQRLAHELPHQRPAPVDPAHRSLAGLQRLVGG